MSEWYEDGAARDAETDVIRVGLERRFPIPRRPWDDLSPLDDQLTVNEEK